MKLINSIMYSQYRQVGSRAVCSLLSLTLGLGIVGITSGRVLAQIPSPAHQIAQTEGRVTEVKMLFVNPSTGNNTSGNGTESAPLQTITQALRVASGNTMIMLAPGTYSADTGEVFPLNLKPGVVIQGDSLSKGQGITIRGGGRYLSRSFGGQNVTVVGADKSELSGVTVTNSNPRGYGLWIESSNTVVTNNTFTGNTQDGVSLAGSSEATIRQNHFHRNGANGITIGGSSQAEILENVFDQTGFGINITQNAAPLVALNQIQNNRSGIVVQANARPMLRNNLIQSNREDGLVAIAQAIPNLGTIAEPGGNEFRNNTRHDINAAAASQIIPAAGNNLAQNRIAGKVDFNAQTAPTAYKPQPSTVANRLMSETSPSREVTFSASTQPQQANQSQINYVNTDPNVIEFTAPQASSPFRETPLSPAANQNTPPTQTTAARPSSALRYRVIVNVANDRERNLVRNLAPGAFPTTRQGRGVMQVGVFSDRTNADSIVRVLNNNGLRTTLEPLN
ncbi:DUF1565 domain-containing protein [Nodularia chucula]|uniref:DUF1565 domain-containing protein n=1 Tax=Nodularia chucula TaxID=3093667 RepID=UPI0039C64780